MTEWKLETSTFNHFHLIFARCRVHHSGFHHSIFNIQHSTILTLYSTFNILTLYSPFNILTLYSPFNIQHSHLILARCRVHHSGFHHVSRLRHSGSDASGAQRRGEVGRHRVTEVTRVDHCVLDLVVKCDLKWWFVWLEIITIVITIELSCNINRHNMK